MLLVGRSRDRIPVASVTGIFLVDTDRTMCPGVNSASKKMSTGDSPEGKGGRCVRLTTYHSCSAERQEIRSLNLPGPPWAISTACCGRDLYLYRYLYLYTPIKPAGLNTTSSVFCAHSVFVFRMITEDKHRLFLNHR